VLHDANEATTWLLSLTKAASREASVVNRTLHTLKTLEEM
jgi:predicted transcriptional regulator